MTIPAFFSKATEVVVPPIKDKNRNNDAESAKNEFDKIFEFIKGADDGAVIRCRSKSPDQKVLYARNGSSLRQSFQKMFDWTSGAITKRNETRDVINLIINRLNIYEIEKSNLTKNINDIVETRDLRKSDLTNFLEAIKKELNTEKIEVKEIELKPLDLFDEDEIDFDNNKILNDEKNILNKLQEDAEILVKKSSDSEQFFKEPSPLLQKSEIIENTDKSPSQVKKRFGGLLVINNNETVVARRSLDKIYADAYLYSGRTPEPLFKSSGKIDKKIGLDNKNIGKFEQLIDYEKRSFLKICLESPLKETDPLVTTLSETNQADYLKVLKEIYRENFDFLVKDFAEDGKILESIALVPISQNNLLTRPEVQALAAAVQEFKKDNPDVLIQIVTDGDRKKSMIEAALQEAAG